MAKQYSEDLSSAQKGGNLDYFDKTRGGKQFSEAAFGLKVGQMSDVVEAPYGFHIIKATGHRDAMTVSFEKVKPSIIDDIKSQKIEEIVGPYLEKIRDEAKIVYPRARLCGLIRLQSRK